MFSASPKAIFPLLVLLILTISCDNSPRKVGNIWTTNLDEVGSFSSSRVADLNKDGILDVIMGAGVEENSPSDTAVFALDGATGAVLWTVSGSNQFVGSAIFQDINKDEIPEVFIGGRYAELVAINGANGAVIWRFFAEKDGIIPADSGWYNFSTPQFIPDQDNDGLSDLIISNGGNPLAAANDTIRPTGRILVLSSQSGQILANVQVPDGREIYMSVVCLDPKNDGNPLVFFGTGGETINGHFYRTSLMDIMKQDISKAKVLVTSKKKGFIAPPAIVDINQDNIYDIIINAVDGKMLAIDGATDSLLWKVHFPGTEAYTTPAIGYFNKDSVPDMLANYGIGVFPQLNQSIHFMVNGKTGTVEYIDTVKGFQYASPLSVDFNHDGVDDGLINLNVSRTPPFRDKIFFSHLLIVDFQNKTKHFLGDTLLGSNVASTPWIGDLDNNQYLDIIYSAVNYKKYRFTPDNPRGLSVTLYKSNIKIKKPVEWGAYMGSDYSGIFPNFNTSKRPGRYPAQALTFGR